MLRKLTYHVRFLISGKPVDFMNDINFETGMTAITGRNGKGKSLTIEMNQFALFGSSALRGKSDDYKNLVVSSTFDIKGFTYVIERTLKDATLFIATDAGVKVSPIATGTKPVNSEVLRLFGYSYDVFQVANVANQGSIEKLGNMKPTERKKMVDETIGLNILDDLEKFISDFVKTLNGEISGMESTLVEPVEPVKPEGYAVSTGISIDLVAIRQKVSELGYLKKEAAKPLPSIRYAGECRFDVSKLEEFESDKASRDILTTELNVMQRELDKAPEDVPYPEDCKFDVSKLSEMEASENASIALSTEIGILKREFDKIPEAKFTSEQLDLWWNQHRILSEFKASTELKKKLEASKVRHECPKCTHEWFDQDPRLLDLVIPVVDFENPPLTTSQILAEQKNIPLQDRKQQLSQEINQKQQKLNEFPDYHYAIVSIKGYKKLLEQAEQAHPAKERKLQLIKEIDDCKYKLAGIPDQSEAISSIKSHLKDLQQQNQDQEAYDKAKVLHDGVIAAIALPEYQGLDEKVVKTELQYSAAISYETLERAYVKQKETYERLVRSLVEKKTEKTSWEGAKKAVTSLRSKVKGYLIPSLNTVASNLINQMTGGELQWIVVNEDFDITVAGQRLETLSGSGKAVANLALRIALGQVLTNKVFSVLMLDEIDASCDDTRAQYISTCVRRLTDTIKQVILISHKSGIEADNYVRL